MNRKHGFTLAEVLITLAIIGVVAAMTIPSLLMSTNQQEFKSGLKKAVSALNQAITMNLALESQNPGDLTDANEFYDFFKRRLSIVSEVPSAGADSSRPWVQNRALYTTDGMRYEFPGALASSRGFTFRESGCGSGGTANLPCIIIADVNGDKKPNPATKDAAGGTYKTPTASDTKIMDVFAIMITDTSAIPFGTVGQRTMFQND